MDLENQVTNNLQNLIDMQVKLDNKLHTKQLRAKMILET